jgi:hypothetical protein
VASTLYLYTVEKKGPHLSAPAGSTPDRSVLWGVLGIVLSWFFLAGIVLSMFSISQARRHGRSPVLGIIGFVLTIAFQVYWYVKFVK